MPNARWAVGTRIFVEWPGGRVPGRVCGWWRLGVWAGSRVNPPTTTATDDWMFG